MQSKIEVLVRAKFYGLVVIWPEPKLFERPEMICKNEVAYVEPDKVFWLLIANFAIEPSQVLEGWAVASAFASPIRLGANVLTKREFLDLLDKQPILDHTNRNLNFPKALALVTPKEEQRSSLDTFMLELLPAKRQQVVPQTMFEYYSM